jgi:hypothetical protein
MSPAANQGPTFFLKWIKACILTLPDILSSLNYFPNAVNVFTAKIYTELGWCIIVLPTLPAQQQSIPSYHLEDSC